MRNFANCILGTFVMVCVGGFSTAYGQAVANPEVTKIIDGWKKLKELDEKTKTYRAELTETVGKTKKSRARVVRSPKSTLVELSQPDGSVYAIRCTNPDYTFLLSSKVIASGQPEYAILACTPPDQPVFTQQGFYDHIELFLLQPLSAFLQGSALDMYESKRLTFTAISDRSDNIITVNFAFLFKLQNIKEIPILGEMQLDSRLNYIIKSVSYHDVADSEIYQFERTISANPSKSRIQVEKIDIKDPGTPLVILYSDYDYKISPPESEFTLSAYGLPEPPEYVSRLPAVTATPGGGPHLVFLGLGIASVIAIIIVAKMRKHKNT